MKLAFLRFFKSDWRCELIKSEAICSVEFRNACMTERKEGPIFLNGKRYLCNANTNCVIHWEVVIYVLYLALGLYISSALLLS